MLYFACLRQWMYPCKYVIMCTAIYCSSYDKDKSYSVLSDNYTSIIIKGCLLITDKQHLHGRMNDFISSILIFYENVEIKLSALVPKTHFCTSLHRFLT